MRCDAVSGLRPYERYRKSHQDVAKADRPSLGVGREFNQHPGLRGDVAGFLLTEHNALDPRITAVDLLTRGLNRVRHLLDVTNQKYTTAFWVAMNL